MRRVGIAAAAVLAAVTLAGCGSSAKTVHIITGSTEAKTVDLGPKGKSPGDDYVFDVDFFDPDGNRKIGHVYGTQTSIALQPDAEVVQAFITYSFDRGDSITIGGVARYPLGEAGLVQNKRFERAIIGGTGKYAGARGTVTSFRMPDGRYDQTFHLEG